MSYARGAVFLILPYAHDRTVYGLPWVTLGFVALHVGAFLVARAEDRAVDARIAVQVLELRDLSARHPSARVPPSVLDALPRDLKREFRSLAKSKDNESAQHESPSEDFAEGASHSHAHAGSASGPHGESTETLTPALSQGNIELDRRLTQLRATFEQRPRVRFGYRAAQPTALAAFVNPWLHDGWIHLLGNAWLLILMGSAVECFWRLGPYVMLYVLSGLAGTLAHHLAQPNDTLPLMGASGALSGVLIAFVVGQPGARLRVLVVAVGRFRSTMQSFEVSPAWAAALLLAQQLAYRFIGAGSRLEYASLLGGALMGLAVAPIARRLGWVATDGGLSFASIGPPLDPNARRAPAPRYRGPLPESNASTTPHARGPDTELCPFHGQPLHEGICLVCYAESDSGA